MATMVQGVGEPPFKSDPQPIQPASPAKPARAKRVLAGLAVVALAGFGIASVTGAGREVTDDAQIEGHVANVAPRVPGLVKRVLVADNAKVNAGDVLIELDDADFRVRAAAAKADLDAAKAQLRAAETQRALTEKTAQSNLVVARGGVTQANAVAGTSRATIEHAKADVVAAESRKKLAETELARSTQLFGEGAISSAEIDARRAAFEQASAAVEQSRARLASALAGVETAVGTTESARGRLIAAETAPEQIAAATAAVELAKARVDQARAALDQAELNLSYTKVRAEVPGVVARRTVEPGQLVSPERPLLAVVPLEDTWVVANFKEDQIAHMVPGQSAEVTVDTFGRQKLHGVVDSLAAGTGSRFSLLPPDNASGNFTKVVQRVPVLVKLDPHPGLTLRPGMSAAVTVATR